MDREETIRVLKQINSGEFTNSDAITLLTQYCLEHGKPYPETANFVINIAQNTQLLSYCLNIALSFYERKFTIYKLWSAPNPLNIQGRERTLLQIF